MSQQDALLDLMWGIWPELPTYGRKAAQFVDLLGYFAIKTPTGPEKKVWNIIYLYKCRCVTPQAN